VRGLVIPSLSSPGAVEVERIGHALAGDWLAFQRFSGCLWVVVCSLTASGSRNYYRILDPMVKRAKETRKQITRLPILFSASNSDLNQSTVD